MDENGGWLPGRHSGERRNPVRATKMDSAPPVRGRAFAGMTDRLRSILMVMTDLCSRPYGNDEPLRLPVP